MKLRPYQEEIISKTIENLKNKKKQLVVLPTGGGKTVIFSHIISRFKKKTLIIAHTQELIAQIKGTVSMIVPPYISVEIRTIQGCIKENTLQHLTDENFELLIIDECHRSASKSYLKVIDRLGFNHKFLCGFTATPYRSDGQSLYSIFGFPENHLTILDMIEMGFLCDLKGYRVSTGVSLRGTSTNKGDFIAARLGAVINVKNRNQLIVREYQKIAPNQKAVCFCASINHSLELSKEFNEKGIKCEALHGEIPFYIRKRILAEFKQGKIQVVTNCNLLTEGFDEPSITCLLMARPTLSKTLYVQMIGRGTRIHPGKENCKVIEFTDNEYDVCQMEELISDRCKKFKINHGESLKDYGKRTEKELLNEIEETHIEEMRLIKKSFFEKTASPWQRNFLKQNGIDFCPEITEIEANNLMVKIYGAH